MTRCTSWVRATATAIEILRHNLDGQPLPEPDAPVKPGASQETVRGPGYYHRRFTPLRKDDFVLREPTIEKLHALRLRILASSWLEQDKSPDALA